MKAVHKNCGYVDVEMPIDTAGNHYIWHCKCETTACQNREICKPPINYFDELYQNELSKSEEKRFYKKVFKTNLL